MALDPRFVAYSPTRRIAKGPTAELFRGHSLFSREEIVLKLYPARSRPSTINSVTSLCQVHFETELRVLLESGCPHICRLLGFGTTLDGTQDFLALEHIAGSSLRDAARQASHESLLNVFLQVAHAVAYLHARGFVHGDIKPTNILVSQERNLNGAVSRATLIDFGSAHSIGDTFAVVHPCLTTPYAAPELLRNGVPTVGSDLFALGATFLECLRGAVPDPSCRSDIHSVSPKGEPGHSAAHPFEADLARLAGRLFSVDPSRRPATVNDLIRAIIRLARDHGVAVWDAFDGTGHLDSFPFIEESKSVLLLDGLIERIAAGSSADPTLAVLTEGPPYEGNPSILHQFAPHLHARGFNLLCANSSESLQAMQHFGLETSAGPWALFVDLPDADLAAGLAQLHLLISSSSRPQLLLMAASEDYARSQDSAIAMHSLRGVVECHALNVRPLTAAALHKCLLVSLNTREIPSDTVSHLHSDTAGSPFLAWHLAAQLAQSGALRPVFDGVALDPCAAQPTVIEAVSKHLASRLGPLPSLCMELAKTLAVARAPMDTTVLSTITGASTHLVGAAADLLVVRGLAARDSKDPSLLSVAGLLARHIAAAFIIPEEQNALHARIAHALCAEEASPVNAVLAACHLACAGDNERAFELFVSAGSHFFGAGKMVDAASAIRQSLALPCGNSLMRDTLQVRLAQAQKRSGLVQESLKTLSSLDPGSGWPAELQISFFLTRGECHYGLGQYQLTREDAQRALHLSRTGNLIQHRIESLHLLGAALCWLDSRTKGVTLLIRAYTRARRSGHKGLAVDALRDIASSHWKAGHYQLAHNYERRRFALLDQSIDTIAAASALINMSIIQTDLGRYQRARQMCRDARRLQGISTQGPQAGALLVNIGETFRAQGAWQVAASANRLAITRLRQSGELHHVAVAESNIACVLTVAGHPGAGLQLLKHRLGRNVVPTSTSIQIVYLLCWSRFLISVGCHAAAHRLLSHASAFAAQKQLWHTMLDFKTSMARCLLSQGAHGNAVALLDKAMAKYGKRSPFEALLSARVARLEACLCLPADHSAHLKELDRVTRLSRRKSMRWHLATCLLIKAESSLAMNEGAKALSAAREAIRVSQEMHDRMLFWRAQLVLGRVHEMGLKHEQALRHYRRGVLTVREIVSDIGQERYRNSFLKRHDVHDLISRHDRLKQEVGRKARFDLVMLKRNEMISRRMLASLSAIGQQLTSILDLDELLASILDLAIENVGAERGVIYLWDTSAGRMAPESARGLGGQDLADLSAFSRGVVEQAALGRTILTVDVGKDPTLSSYQSLIVNEVKSILCVPMRARGRVVGLIYLDTQKVQRLFTDKERTFVESFASQAAIAVENARVFGAMRAENKRLRDEVEERFKDLVGRSVPMQRLRETLASVIDSDCTVLITGESGTGKGLVARAIHLNGSRRQHKFLTIDCGALPEHLQEAELFGNARGAFTGADRSRVGLIEDASGGTLFLDEITNTSLGLQAKLLRVLQEREVRRLGENETRRVDVRFIAATNADIKSLMAQSRFRPDLYYRLNVVTIQVPPLRDRRDDIPLLSQHILAAKATTERPSKALAPGVVQALMRHDWPGNIRELENVLERAAVLSRGPAITTDDLPGALGRVTDLRSAATGTGHHAKTGEQVMIEETLQRFQGDKTKAARHIGWTRDVAEKMHVGCTREAIRWSQGGWQKVA